MSNVNSRLVSVVTLDNARRRVRRMGAEASLDSLLENWWRRLAHQIENGQGASATTTWEVGSLPVDLVAEQLLAAYQEAGPGIVGTTFPPLMAAVLADDDDAQAVMTATQRRLGL